MKQFILSAWLLCFFGSLHAQLALGLAGGLNLSNINYNLGANDLEPNFLPAFFAGVHGRYPINDRFSILADLQYSQKGANFSNNILLFNSKVRFTYLDIIPQLEVKLNEQLGLTGGLNVGIALSEAQQSDGEDWMDLTEFDPIKNTDFGVLLGLRAYFQRLYVSVHYNLGIQNIANVEYTDPNGTPIRNQRQSNRTFQLGVGYYIYSPE